EPSVLDRSISASCEVGSPDQSESAQNTGIAPTADQIWPRNLRRVGGRCASRLDLRRLVREIAAQELLPEQFAQVGFGFAKTIHRSEEHTSELQSRFDLVCRLLLEKKNNDHQLWHD